MPGRRDPWPEGRDAWNRLDGWDHAGPVGEAAGSSAADAALDALSDLGVVRRLLDQTELAAVRAARANRKSWAEIATRLGMTRQSAWERWRDLDGDEQSGASRVPARSGDEPSPSEARRAGQRAVDEAARHAAALTAVVPDVGGLSWEDARDTLLQAHLVAVNADPDLPPLPRLGAVRLRGRRPEAGARHAPCGVFASDPVAGARARPGRGAQPAQPSAAPQDDPWSGRRGHGRERPMTTG
jgi:hypothetical protein